MERHKGHGKACHTSIVRDMTEPMIETLELDIDENNELLFKVGIEGHVTGPAKVRLVCEADDVSYIFPGRPTEDGIVQFVLHKAAGLKEGTYPAKVEVLLENRYFVPVMFNINLKRAVTVVAEAVQLPKPIKKQDIIVSAVPVVVKAKVEPKPVVIEGPQKVVANEKVVSIVVVEKHPVVKAGTLAERYGRRSKGLR